MFPRPYERCLELPSESIKVLPQKSTSQYFYLSI